MNYWLVKSEPTTYSWQQFIKEGNAVWDGVRNYQARNNLKQMKINDLVLFYHSNTGKEIVGLAKVLCEAYPDPTTEDKRWVAVTLTPVEEFKKTVKIKQIKVDIRLKDVPLIKQSRLSVMSLTKKQFDILYQMAK